MNLFHAPSMPGLSSYLLFGIGLGFALIAMVFGIISSERDGKRKSIAVTGTICGLYAVLAIASLVGQMVMMGINTNSTKQGTTHSLQAWMKQEYGISLTQHQAEQLYGFGGDPQQLTIQYEGKRTQVRLVRYKDGYTLMNVKTKQQVPQMESQSKVDK